MSRVGEARGAFSIHLNIHSRMPSVVCSFTAAASAVQCQRRRVLVGVIMQIV